MRQRQAAGILSISIGFSFVSEVSSGASSLCSAESEPHLYVGWRGGIGVYVQQGLDFGLARDIPISSNKDVKQIRCLQNRLVVATQQGYFVVHPDTGYTPSPKPSTPNLPGVGAAC